MDVGSLIEKGYLERIGVDEKLVQKEFNEAEYDLEKAKLALRGKDFKWTIIKAYYSMFHAAKAVLFSMGLREKRHFVVGIILEKLSKRGKLQFRFVDDYKGAMMAREDADYRYIHTKEAAEYVIDMAEGFLGKMRKVSKEVKPNELI